VGCRHKQRVTDMGDYICALSKQKGNDEGYDDDICEWCDDNTDIEDDNNWQDDDEMFDPASEPCGDQ
jgi:hypothetical protein